MDVRKGSLYILLIALCIGAQTDRAHGQSIWTTTGAASFCAVSGDGTISTNAAKDSILKWESSTDNVIWVTTGTDINKYAIYSALTQSTCFRAIVKNGTAFPDTSIISCITIYPQSAGGSVSGSGTFCVGNGKLTLLSYTGNVLNWSSSTNGGSSWSTVSNTTDSLVYSSITQTTMYRVFVQQSCPGCSPNCTGCSSQCLVDSSSQGVVSISPSVGGTINGGGPFCDSTGAITLTLSGNIGTVINWESSIDNGATWSLIANTSSIQSYSNSYQNMLHRAMVQLDTCPVDTSSIESILIQTSDAGSIINNDTTVDYNDNGDDIRLVGNIGNVVEWQKSLDRGLSWENIANTTTIEPYSNLIDTTSYRAIVQTAGCSSDTSNIFTVTVLPKSIMITNLFSPNGDGVNDSWYIKGIQNYQDSEVFIYNVYGILVYSMKEYQNDWQGTYNGKDLPNGTYYYIVKLQDSDVVKKGTLDIIRGN